MRLGIVGAGQAACTLIAELIRGDFKGDMLVFNGEPHAPYQRPPLSKNWLKTSDDPTSLRLLPEPLETHPSIQWIQASVQSLSPDRGLLTTDQGTYLVDHLVLATGTTAIKPSIPGLASESIHVVRTLDHAQRLKQSLEGVTNITIIGAGFLAFELASSLADPSRTIRILAKGIRALPQVAVKTADRLVDQAPASIRVGVEIERFDETTQA
jgi:3-phenylpropionate/trans-cinnamate dioxygenase ferredoxin reductase subunit